MSSPSGLPRSSARRFRGSTASNINNINNNNNSIDIDPVAGGGAISPISWPTFGPGGLAPSSSSPDYRSNASAVLPGILSYPSSPSMPSRTPIPARASATPATSSSHPHHPFSNTASSAQQTHPLLAHLYESFLRGSCSDITVRIDQWGLEYKLHRVVLIQAGFFHSLFLGGFCEGEEGSPNAGATLSPGMGKVTMVKTRSKAGQDSPNASRQGGRSDIASKETSMGGTGIHAAVQVRSDRARRDLSASSTKRDDSILNLGFDDGNITRCAFEICIARLYSNRPKLHLSPALLPSPTYPLTPSFPNAPLLSDLISPPDDPPSPSATASTILIQPASPRLLLSLLATSIYLGQNDVVRETLGLILGSVSPWSVGRYLGFAIGLGIGSRDAHEEPMGGVVAGMTGGSEDVLDNCAKGMEGIGRKIEARGIEARKHRSDLEGAGTSGKEGRGIAGASIRLKTQDRDDENDFKPSESALRDAINSHRSSEELDGTKVCELAEPHRLDFQSGDRAISAASAAGDTSFLTSTSEGAEGLDLDTVAYGKRYFYGFGGDKIGEACIAWLSRWGQDLLEVEELQLESKLREDEREARRSRDREDASGDLGSRSPFAGLEDFSRLGVAGPSLSGGARSVSTSRERRSRSISFQLPMEDKPTLFSISPGARSGGTKLGPETRRTAELSAIFGAEAASSLCVWGHGGLPAAWVRAIISSDEFFIENELARYQFAKRVLELRRMSKERIDQGRNSDSGFSMKEEHVDVDRVPGDPADAKEEEEAWEEAELAEMFVTGIHYSHMPFEELKALETDFNPSTNQPYVPIGVLQAASWAALDLKGTICAYKPDGSYPLSMQNASPLRSLSGSRSPAPKATPNPANGLALTTSDIVHAVELALRPATPRWNDRSASPRLYSSLGRDNGNSTFSSSGVTSPTASPRRTRNPMSGLPQQPSAADCFYWPVPVDNTVRIGDAASHSAAFQPFHPFPDLGPGVSPEKADGSGLNTGESNVFGFGSSMRTGLDIVEMSEDGAASEARPDALWSKYEPFRFSVEFWNVEALGEKERAYSKTVFHAGSYFNIYVQTLKKKDKGTQLGIYLHRQSMLEPLPAASKATEGLRTNTLRSISPMGWNLSTPALHQVVSGSTGQNPLAMHRTISQPQPETPAGHLSISPPVHAGSHDEDGHADQITTSPRAASSRNAPLSPYRDPRSTARVFFSVSCASAMGTALTRFSSGPDSFAVSQSWGWRSSSLRSQEYLAGGASDGGPSANERLDSGVLGWVSDPEADWTKRSLSSLRASVVLGVL